MQVVQVELAIDLCFRNKGCKAPLSLHVTRPSLHENTTGPPPCSEDGLLTGIAMSHYRTPLRSALDITSARQARASTLSTVMIDDACGRGARASQVRSCRAAAQRQGIAKLCSSGGSQCRRIKCVRVTERTAAEQAAPCLAESPGLAWPAQGPEPPHEAPVKRSRPRQTSAPGSVLS